MHIKSFRFLFPTQFMAQQREREESSEPLSRRKTLHFFFWMGVDDNLQEKRVVWRDRGSGHHYSCQVHNRKLSMKFTQMYVLGNEVKVAVGGVMLVNKYCHTAGVFLLPGRINMFLCLFICISIY